MKLIRYQGGSDPAVSRPVDTHPRTAWQTRPHDPSGVHSRSTSQCCAVAWVAS